MFLEKHVQYFMGKSKRVFALARSHAKARKLNARGQTNWRRSVTSWRPRRPKSRLRFNGISGSSAVGYIGTRDRAAKRSRLALAPPSAARHAPCWRNGDDGGS